MDLHEQIAVIERLGQVAVGSLFHGLHGALDRPVCRQNDHRQVRVDLAEILHQVDPVCLRELQIQKGDIETPSRILSFASSVSEAVTTAYPPIRGASAAPSGCSNHRRQPVFFHPDLTCARLPSLLLQVPIDGLHLFDLLLQGLHLFLQRVDLLLQSGSPPVRPITSLRTGMKDSEGCRYSLRGYSETSLLKASRDFW